MNTKPSFGLTLVELMIVVAVVAVLLTLAAPSLYDFILVQRLKGVNAQLVTDLQFARSMATSSGRDVQFVVKPAGSAMSCYTLYSDTASNPAYKCDCAQPEGLRCTQPTTQELRTVQIPNGSGVRLALPTGQGVGISFMASTGALRLWPTDAPAPTPEFMVEASIDAQRKLNTWVGLSGRPTVCAPGGAVTGSLPC